MSSDKEKPAEKLLERIRAEKERKGAEAEAARKPRKPRKGPVRRARQPNLLANITLR